MMFHQNDDNGHAPHKGRCWFILLQTKILGSVKSPKPGWRVASKIYPSQTKIWEGGTKDEIQIFEALLKGVSTRFGLRTIEKSVENLDFIFCQTFQNLRLGSIKFVYTFCKPFTKEKNSMLPKRRFWKD